MLINFDRKVLAWTMAVGLSVLPLTAAINQQVVGKVVRSSGASLGGAVIPDEGTIVAGDSLSTGKGGSALVKLSATTQASLGGETTVLFRKDAARLSVKVSAGTVLVETMGKDAPVVETAEYKAEPSEQGKANYLVAVLPDKTTVITARRGRISIKEIDSGKTYLLPEGYKAVSAATSSAAASAQEREEPKQAPGAPAGPSTEGPPEEAAATTHRTLIIILAAGGAAAIAGAAIAAGGGGAPASSSVP